MYRFIKREDFKLLAKCGLVASLIIVGLFVPILNIAAVAATIFFIAMQKDEDTFCMLAFLVLFAPIFKVQLGGFCLLNIVMLAAVVIKVIKNKWKMEKNAGVMLLIFCAYSVVGGFANGITLWLSFIVYIAFITLWYRPSVTTIDFHKYLDFFILGIIITSIVAMCEEYFPRLAQLLAESATIDFGDNSFYRRFSGLENNPNYYTVSISVCIACIMVIIHKGKAKAKDYVFLVLLSVFGFKSVSQSFITAYILTLILFVIFGEFKKINKTFSRTFIISVAILLVFFLLDDSVITTILFRADNSLAETSLDGITTGRLNLWVYYLKYFFYNLFSFFFGRGIGARNLGVGASHSYFIDIFYYLGIIGGVIYTTLLYRVFKIKKPTGMVINRYRYIPFIVFAVRAMARNLIMSEQFVFILLLCVLAIEDQFKENKELM